MWTGTVIQRCAHMGRHKGTQTCVRRDAETVDVRTDARARTDLEPRPPPAEGFPARCSDPAANKSQLIRTLPLNRSPSLCCDQISEQGRKRKSPLFLLLRLPLRAAPRRGAAWGPAPCPAPTRPLSITLWITGAVTGRSSGLGFNRGSCSPRQPSWGPYTWV